MKTPVFILTFFIATNLFGQITIDNFNRHSLNLDSFTSTNLAKELSGQPKITESSMSADFLGGGYSNSTTKHLYYKQDGILLDFTSYSDTFYLEKISLKKSSKFVTVDNVHAKQKISLKTLGLDINNYRETYIETIYYKKRYGLIKKNNIKYYVSFKNKKRVTADTKFKIKHIDIDCL